MHARPLHGLCTPGRAVVHHLRRHVVAATRPCVATVAAGTLVDLVRNELTLLVGRVRAWRHALLIV